VNESAPHRLNPFLADLAQAMRSTAETARTEAVERCRAEARPISSRSRLAWATNRPAFETLPRRTRPRSRSARKAEAEQVRVENRAPDRPSPRAPQAGTGGVQGGVAAEAQRVQERVVAFEDELTKFFEKILAGDADPRFSRTWLR